MIKMLYPNIGWEILSKEDYAETMRELRSAAAEVIDKENVEHVIYATKEYKEEDGSQNIKIKPYLLKCTDEQFEEYCSRESENHIIKAIHKH